MSTRSAFINPRSKIPEIDQEDANPSFPEKRLAAAVLLRAILDTRALEKKQIIDKGVIKHYNTNYRKDAWEFLREDHDQPYPAYSALWCFEIFCSNPKEAQRLTIEACKLAAKKKKRAVKRDCKELQELIDLIRKEKSSK